MENPLISILIPVKNGSKTISRCIDAIQNQTIFNICEVIVIDSGSTDETLEILKEYKFISLYQIPPEEFSHGGTRNYAVSLAKGEFIMFTVQDAELNNDKILEIAIKQFENSKVMAVGGRQAVPHRKGTNPQHWYRPVSKAKVEYFQFNNLNMFANLSPAQKRWACSLDNVVAFYRKKALLSIPFRKTDFGEDLQWAIDAYKNDYLIVFDSNLIAWHYHVQNYSYTFQLVIILSYIDWKFFDLSPDVRFKVIDALKIIFRNFRYKAHPKWIIYNIVSFYANFKARKVMNKAIKDSEEAANQLFIKYCKSIPQGKQ